MQGSSWKGDSQQAKKTLAFMEPEGRVPLESNPHFCAPFL
jgi:hypothetical protein